MPTRPERSQAGSAVVEFALVLPLVLVVALSLVQVGLLVRDRLLVEAAARAGARGLYRTSMCSTARAAPCAGTSSSSRAAS
ncbi:MAG: TadE/TadG family type IV pilus assembly protein [Actinomycetota bacterium]